MNDDHCQDCGVAEGEPHRVPCNDDVSTAHAVVDEHDVKALVNHYRCEVRRWGPEEPHLTEAALEQLDYWLEVSARMR